MTEEVAGQPDPTTVSQPQTKPRRRRLILLVLVGLLFLAGGVSARYWYGTKSPQLERRFPKSQPIATPTVSPYSTIYRLSSSASLSGKIRFIAREDLLDSNLNYVFKVVTIDLSTLKSETTYKSANEYFKDLTEDGRFLSVNEEIKDKVVEDGTQKFQLIDLLTNKVIFSANHFGGPNGVSAALIYNKYLSVLKGMGSHVLIDPNTGRIIAEHPLVPFASSTWSFSPSLRYLAYERPSYYYGGMPGVGPLTTSLGFIDLVNNSGQNIEPFAATDRWSDGFLRQKDGSTCWKEEQLLFKRTFFKDLKENVVEKTQIIKIDPSNKQTEILCDQNCEEKEKHFKSTCDKHPFYEEEKQKARQIENIKRLIPPKLNNPFSLSTSPDKKLALFEADNPDNYNQRAVYIIDLLNQKIYLVGRGQSPRWIR